MERVIFSDDEMTATIQDTKEVRDKVFEKVLEYYTKHQSFCGEVIMQSDNPIINAPDVLSNIADGILKINVKWVDDDDQD